MIICSQLCKLHWHAADKLSRVSRGGGSAAPPAMQPSAVLSSPAAAPGSQAAGSPAPAATGAAAALASPPPQQPRPQQRAPQQAPPQASPTQQRFPAGARSSAVVEGDVQHGSPEAEVITTHVVPQSCTSRLLMSELSAGAAAAASKRGMSGSLCSAFEQSCHGTSRGEPAGKVQQTAAQRECLCVVSSGGRVGRPRGE